jgi:hypothetical protein
MCILNNNADADMFVKASVAYSLDPITKSIASRFALKLDGPKRCKHFPWPLIQSNPMVLMSIHHSKLDTDMLVKQVELTVLDPIPQSIASRAAFQINGPSILQTQSMTIDGLKSHEITVHT